MSGISNSSASRDFHSSHARLHNMEQQTPQRFASKSSAYSNSPSTREYNGGDSRLRIDPSAPSSASSFSSIHARSRMFDQRQEVYEHHSSHRPRSTRSEPGVGNSDHDRFAAYVNRFAMLEKQRREKTQQEIDRRQFGDSPGRGQSNDRFGPRSSDRSTGSSSQMSDRIRQYNQGYSDPEPQLVPSDEDFQSQQRANNSNDVTNLRQSSTIERRQAASPLERTHEEKYSSSRRGRDGYNSKSQNTQYSADSRSKHRHSNQRGSSLPPNSRPASGGRNTGYPGTPSSSQPDMERFSQSVPNFDDSVERPARTSIKDLKRQLWDNDETLQVSVRPTLAYADGDASYHDHHRRKTYYGRREAPEMAGKKGHRSTRSLSPGRRSISSQDGSEKKFNSKYYEAAIAARLRGKVRPTEVLTQGDRDHKDSDRRSRPEPSRTRDGSVERRGWETDASQNNRSSTVSSERRLSSSNRDQHARSVREASIERRDYGSRFVEDRSKIRGSSVERSGRKRETSIDRRVRSMSVDRKAKEWSAERKRDSFSIFSREARPPRGEQSPFFAQRKSQQIEPPSVPHAQMTSHQASADRRESGKSHGDTPPLVRSGSWTVSSVRQRGQNSFETNKSWEKQAPMSDNKHANFELARQNSGTNISKLVAKLSAVNRQNPSQALAEIDSILKAESDSNGGGSSLERSSEKHLSSSSNVPGRDSNEEEEEDTCTDDETTVSSITNPTYQSVRGGHDQICISSPDQFLHGGKIPTAIGHNPTNPFGHGPPSTAAFRRPRPSNLQSYVAPPQESMPTAEKLPGNHSKDRKLRSRDPPPSTIKTKTPSPSNTARSNDMPFGRERSTSPVFPDRKVVASNIERGQVDNEQGQDQDFDTDAKKSKLDSFMSNSSALAEQIRVWDELSTGIDKSRSMESTNDRDETAFPTGDMHEKRNSISEAAKPAADIELPKTTKSDGFGGLGKSSNIPILPAPPQPASGRRAHPWDKSIPIRHEKVSAKDTSMDDGDGVEMLFENRNEAFSGFEGFDDASNTGKEALDERATAAQAVTTTGILSGDKEVNSSFGSHQRSSSLASGWEVTPRITPQQHENAQKISDDFDAAWVSLPASTFFPDIHQSTPQRRQFSKEENFMQVPEREEGRQNRHSELGTPSKRRGVGPVDVDDSYQFTPNSIPLKLAEAQGRHDSREFAAINDFEAMQNFSVPHDYVEPGKIEVSLLEQSPAKPTPAKRNLPAEAMPPRCFAPVSPPVAAEAPPKRKGGFLSRAFGRRDKKKNAAADQPRSKNSSQPAHNVAASINREPPMLPVLPAPQFDQKEIAPPPGRGRKGARTPTRSRSRSRSSSLERIRSSSMAEKFSRVMRLYEHE